MSTELTACPHCGFDFGLIPTRRRRCPGCARIVYVKSLPTDRVRRLMTEEQASTAEVAWSRYHWRQQLLQWMSPFGLTDSDLAAEEERNGTSDIDAACSLLQRVAKEDTDLHSQKMAYYQLALLADRTGKPFVKLLTEASRRELLRYRQSGVIQVEIATGGPGNSCRECESQAHRILAIEDALREMPLPCQRCTKTLFSTNPGFCRCSYLPVIKTMTHNPQLHRTARKRRLRVPSSLRSSAAGELERSASCHWRPRRRD